MCHVDGPPPREQPDRTARAPPGRGRGGGATLTCSRARASSTGTATPARTPLAASAGRRAGCGGAPTGAPARARRCSPAAWIGRAQCHVAARAISVRAWARCRVGARRAARLVRAVDTAALARQAELARGEAVAVHLDTLRVLARAARPLLPRLRTLARLGAARRRRVPGGRKQWAGRRQLVRACGLRGGQAWLDGGRGGALKAFGHRRVAE